MKVMKRFAGIVLALVMVLCLTAPALAANVTINTPESEDENYTPTYTAYKIFDAEPLDETSETVDDEVISSFENVAYSIHKESPFLAKIEAFTTTIKVTEDGAETEKTVPVFTVYSKNDTHNVVALAEGVTTFDAAALATELKTVIDDTANADKLASFTTSFNGASAELTNGYFLITSSLGDKMIVDTFGKENMTINTKNQFPTLTKTIASIDEVAVNGDNGTATYGDTVTFNIVVNIPETSNKTITVHDTMDTGLEYIGMTAVEGVTEVSNPTDDCSVEFVISDTLVAKHQPVTITYTAKFTADATPGTAIKNNAHLTYETYTTPDSETKVYTYSFNLVKTNSKNEILSGAEFELYDAATEGTKIGVVKESDGVYRVAVAGETAEVIKAGNVTIKGLAEGTYYLEETKAPEGYNRLNTRQPVEVNANSTSTTPLNTTTDATTGIITYNPDDNIPATEIENLTGAELPSTGGIGTTIFYIAGGVLAVGAGILLVTKKRVGAKED